jgi:hypothetical protein
MSYSQDDFYSDDPIEGTSSPVKKKFPGFVAFLLFIFAGGSFLQTTLAANINLNPGGQVEFGQGVAMVSACSGSNTLTVTPNSSFTNASNSGTFYLGSITVSGIPTSCYGSEFQINAFGTTSSAPLAIYNSTSTDAVIGNNQGTFVSQGSQPGLSVTTNSTSSFTVVFTNPVATSSNFVKLTIQSRIANFAYGPTRGIQFVPLSGIQLSQGINENNAFTIEGWFRSNDWSQMHALVPYVGNACFAVVIASESSSTWRTSLDCQPNSVTYTLPGSATMANNEWLYWVYVKDSNGQSMFINGVKLTPASFSNGGSNNLPLNPPTNDLGSIGEWYAWNTDNWDSEYGIIGEMRISNIARVASTASSFNPAYASTGKPLAQLTSDASTTMLLIAPASGSTFTDASGTQTLTVITTHGGVGTAVPPVLVSVP